MSAVLRFARFHDLLGVQKVATRSWYDTYRDTISTSSIQQFLERAYSLSNLEHRLQNTHLYVVEQDSLIVGFANFSRVDESGFATLIAIYLLPENQGQGLGKKLIKCAIQDLLPIKGIHLEVSTKNEQAIHFYRRLGFEVLEKYSVTFFEDVLHTTKMSLNLST